MAISIDARKQSMKNERNQLVNKPSFFNYHMDLKKAYNKNLNIERGSADFFFIETHTTMRVLPSRFDFAFKFHQNVSARQTYLLFL